jgi:DNA-binding beta-propeller fold protein YncE
LSNAQFICVPQLDVINLATNAVITTIPISGNTERHTNILGGPVGLAITPDGNHAYVSASNQTEGLLQVVDTNPSSSSYNTVVATIDLGPLISNATGGAAVTPDGALVYLATTNFGGIVSPSQGGIYVIATATNTVVGSFSLAAGTQPTAVTITPAAANRNICPESQGFWKDHGRLWPVASLVLGGRTYTEDQLLMLLSTSSAGNAALILTDELIATELNLDVGSNPASISSSVTAADSELAAVPALPTVVRTNTTAGQAMEATAATLDSYNIDSVDICRQLALPASERGQSPEPRI